MVVKWLSSMHHFVPTQSLPAPLLLPSPFPQIISCRTISNMASFRLPLVLPQQRGRVRAGQNVGNKLRSSVATGVTLEVALGMQTMEGPPAK